MSKRFAGRKSPSEGANGVPPSSKRRNLMAPVPPPPTDPPTTSPPTNPPATSPPTDPPTTSPATSPPIDPPSVSGPLPPPLSAEDLVLTVSDLGALIRLLYDAAHCTKQLGIFLDLGPDLVRSLKDKALGDPFDHLSLVLETRLKHMNPPLSLKDLTEAISLPPISNEALARKLRQFFMSDERRNRPSIAHLSPAMADYSQFLDDIYQIAAIPPDPKGGPETSIKYTNLAVIKKEKVSQAEADKFTKATLHGGIDEIMHEKKAIELKDIFKPDEGQVTVNFVLAEGVPGVGKSTMAWELCRQRHEIEAIRTFTAVVLLRLREKKVQEAESVADLLYHDDPEIKEAVVQEICSTRGENILFVLDGFDEVPRKIRKSMFVANIISGQCLSKATVLVTSRPSARADLLSLRKPDKHIEVLGFTYELIKQYASSVFGSSTPLLDDFLKYVSTNPSIKSMMYIPLNCAIVVEIYGENREEGRPIPQTMTQLYSELTLTLMRRHHSDTGGELENFPTKLEDLAEENPEFHTQLLILAKLAFNGTLDQEVIFKKLPDRCSTLGLMTASQQLYISRRGSSNYSFFHLSLQEFLSAYYISQLTGSEQKKAFKEYSEYSHLDGVWQKKAFKEYSEYSHLDVVWRFVAGLTGYVSIGWDWVYSMSQMRSNGVYVSSFFIQCFYEAQQKVQCELILGQRSELSFTGHSAFSSFACGYCVAVSQSTWKVWLKSRPEAWEMFVYGLTSQEEVHGSIRMLSLGGNPIGLEGMARFKDIPRKALQQLSVLHMIRCKLDGSALDHLADVIPSMTSLEELHIGENPAAGNGGTVKVIQALQVASVSRLYIADIPIGRGAIEALSYLISPSGPLKVLRIGDQGMQCDCVELLLKVVFSPSSLQTLYLRNISIDKTSLSFTPLKENHNITELEIYQGTIGSRDISCIAEVLRTDSTLERLVIGSRWNSVQLRSDPTDIKVAVSDLANSLKINRSLEKLILHLTRHDGSLALEREAAQALIDALQDNPTLEHLILPECEKYFSQETPEQLTLA